MDDTEEIDRAWTMPPPDGEDVDLGEFQGFWAIDLASDTLDEEE
jgi:hypothetical protein